jgi:hypothetical protein
MDEFEVRAKAAELSVTMAAQMSSAMIIHSGVHSLTELSPLAFASEFEEYIRTGKIPAPIKVKKTEV